MRCPDCAAWQRQEPVAKRRSRRPLAAGALALAVVLAVAFFTPATDGQTVPDEVESLPAAEVPGIGQEVVVGQFVVTVQGFQCGPTDIETRSPVTVRRCSAQLLVRHDGPDARQFPASLQRAAEASRRFGPRTQAAVTVNPGAVAEVVIDYTVPPNVVPTRLELRGSPRETPVRVGLPT